MSLPVKVRVVLEFIILNTLLNEVKDQVSGFDCTMTPVSLIEMRRTFRLQD